MQQSDSEEFHHTECQKKASPQQVSKEETDTIAGKTYMVLSVNNQSGKSQTTEGAGKSKLSQTGLDAIISCLAF